MICSLRGLVILVGLAVVAVIAAWLTPAARTSIETVDRRIAPVLVADHVTKLRWSTGIELAKRDAGWTWTGRDLPVDPTAIDEIVAALRGGTWQRREPKARAGSIHVTLTATSDATTVELGIGEPLAGSEQVWLVSDGRALLVDAWIARALEPSPLDLRVKRPFAHVTAAQDVTVELARGGHPTVVELVGQPRRSAGVLVDADKVLALEQALTSLELVADRAPAAVTTTPAVGLVVRSSDVIDVHGGPHGTSRFWKLAAVGEASCGVVTTGVLAGCVARDTWRAVVGAVTALAGPARSIIERRPARISGGTVSLASIALPDGVIDLTRRAIVDGNDADRERVDELVAALSSPSAIVPLPTTAATGAIEIHRKDGATFILELHAGTVVRRGEPVGLAITPPAWAIITRPATSYRDPTLWLEEPTSITTLTIDNVTYTAGTQLGTWSRDGAGPPAVAPSAAEKIDEAVRSLATLRAPPAALPASFTVRHTIAISAARPSGPPVRHLLEIGEGCVARVEGRGVALPADICRLVALGR